MIEFRHVTYSVPSTEPAPVAEPSAAETVEEEGLHKILAQSKKRRPPSRKLILDDVSFVVPERSITCIMGVSGTGKTTLLRLMAGLLKPDEGEILIEGRDIVGLKENELNDLRRQMGFVFQYGALFDSLNVAENVGFGLEQARRPRKEIAEIVERRLTEVGLPDPAVQSKLPSEISGGMRKRVAMARAIATEPKIVLYDEPTSGLDPVMARVIDDLIVQLRDENGTTNVVVSHHLESILRISDRVLMLHDAKLVAEGPPDEVRRSGNDVVRQFLEGRAEGPITVA
jgi:phospholipid/cholesterol/gamma-HCH transport system ATP-binding protein